MPVTRRQREILDYISKHIEEKGYAPSFEEIARQFGFQSLEIGRASCRERV